MYRPLLIVLAGLVAAVAPVAPAMARSCGAQAPIEDEFASSSAVLLGRVIAISRGQREYSTDVPGEILRIATRVATVEGEREWKGPDHGIVAIETCALCTTAARAPRRPIRSPPASLPPRWNPASNPAHASSSPR